MFSPNDTIVAIATPSGRGGIGVVRVSGPAAREIAAAILSSRKPLLPRQATFTHVKSPDSRSEMREPRAEVREPREGQVRESSASHNAGPGCRPANGGMRHLDQVVATYFEQPASYTGEDVIEISAHGSPVVLREIVKAAMQAGARLAEPGEFTFRAFLNGRIDLVQAEAVADLIDAVTPLQARAAYDQLEGTLTQEIGAIDAALFDLVARFEASIDFPEEGYHFIEAGTSAQEIGAIEQQVTQLLAQATRGRLIREGAQVAIVGKPNVGKSSLFNTLVGSGRAIVAPLPGTTRDFITELTDIGGLRITLIDTAGERETAADENDGHAKIDDVERQGIERARGARAVADLLLVMLDRSRPLDEMDRRILEETAARPRVIVINKADLPEAWSAHAVVAATAATEKARLIVLMSAHTREGLDGLSAAVVRALSENGAERDTAAVTNVRHIDLLDRAAAALARARGAIAASGESLSEEFILADLQDARNAFEEIVGKRTPDDVLAHIFGRFCIGK